jgi:ferric-dicitrate binding protein FerR (iron transport regulator)
MDSTNTWVLLGKYLSGECTDRERETVKAWVQEDPARRRLLADLRRIWAEANTSSEDAPVDLDLESEWNRLKARMDAGDTADSESGRGGRSFSTDRPPQSRSRRTVVSGRSDRSDRADTAGSAVRIGSAVAAAIAVVLGILWIVGGPDALLNVASDPEPYREVVTERGERARVQFADGTTAMLNVDSRLQLPGPFDAGRRVVHLTGEAFFEVETDSTRPFVLKTDDATVRVTGTSFNVRGYPDDEDVEVAVAEGGVVFRSHQAAGAEDRAELALTTGDVARLRRASARVTKRESADLDSFTAWTRGRLLFENTPLRQVAGRLERWYNLDFEIRDAEIASLRLTADLKSQSVRNVLDVISATLNIEYRIDNGTVYLTSKAPVQSRT